MYFTLQSIASTSNTTLWWELQTQTEWVIFEPAGTHHLGLKAQNFENQIFTFRYFSLKAVYNPCKLQRLLQTAKFLFMYSFTTSLFRHLPTEIVIFINVCYPIQCFSGDSFSFFSEQVPIIFHLLSWFHVQFNQGTPRHYNILNSTFETIYQVPRKEFVFWICS